MKILIIGQWIYPLITPRANRTWELAKGFAMCGHDVTVYALLGDRDYTYEANKYNLKIKNLGKSKRGLIDSQGVGNRSLYNRILGRLVGEYNSYPGIDFFSMVRKCFEREKSVDLLVTIAHPHVIHWAASKYLHILQYKCWIADCGDPFMGNQIYKPKQRYAKFEKDWCNKVDCITVPIEDAIRGYYPEYKSKIHVIPQGFDNSEIILSKYKRNSIPTFAFAGVIYEGIRDPFRFLDYLDQNKIDCKFIVYSDSNAFLAYETKLRDRLEVRQKMPRNELIEKLSSCDFLLNIANGTSVQTPSKLIDYAVSGRPILTITSSFDEIDKQKFEAFLHADYTAATIVNNIEKYSIDIVVQQFIHLYSNHVN